MHLEALCQETAAPVRMPLEQDAAGTWRADWRPLLRMLGDDSRSRALRAEIFHASMAHVVLDQARIARDEHDVAVVGLSGGVFQNRVLTDQVMELLRSDGFEVLLPSILPVNDAGLSFGQAAEMAARDNQD
jgi:hydrogenase maturation protein HypF